MVSAAGICTEALWDPDKVRLFLTHVGNRRPAFWSPSKGWSHTVYLTTTETVRGTQASPFPRKCCQEQAAAFLCFSVCQWRFFSFLLLTQGDHLCSCLLEDGSMMSLQGRWRGFHIFNSEKEGWRKEWVKEGWEKDAVSLSIATGSKHQVLGHGPRCLASCVSDSYYGTYLFPWKKLRIHRWAQCKTNRVI